MSQTAHERYEVLLVKATDGMLTDAERGELDAHLAECASCREELDDFAKIKETTDAMTDRILKDALIEPPREAPSTRALLSASFVALLVGTLVLLGFAAYTFFADAEVPWPVKLGAGVAGLGALALLLYTLRVRLRALKRDPYREIDL